MVELIPSDLGDSRNREAHSVETDNPLAFILRAVWRSRYLLSAAVVLGGATGLFLGTIKPNEFQSMGKLLVRPGLREALTPEGRQVGS